MAKDKPQPQTGPEIEEYSTTATPKAYAGRRPRVLRTRRHRPAEGSAA